MVFSPSFAQSPVYDYMAFRPFWQMVFGRSYGSACIPAVPEKQNPARMGGELLLAEGAGFDLLCGAGRLGLRHAPGMPPSALGFESCSFSENKTPPRWAEFCFLANNPDFDTVTPSWKSGVSLMPKWGQVDRAWGQIVNYVNHMGSKNPAGACPAGLLFFVYLVAGLLDHSE
jgi:hypothetical protein